MPKDPEGTKPADATAGGDALTAPETPAGQQQAPPAAPEPVLVPLDEHPDFQAQRTLWEQQRSALNRQVMEVQAQLREMRTAQDAAAMEELTPEERTQATVEKLQEELKTERGQNAFLRRIESGRAIGQSMARNAGVDPSLLEIPQEYLVSGDEVSLVEVFSAQVAALKKRGDQPPATPAPKPGTRPPAPQVNVPSGTPPPTSLQARVDQMNLHDQILFYSQRGNVSRLLEEGSKVA